MYASGAAVVARASAPDIWVVIEPIMLVAFASGCGGIGSPRSSRQNARAAGAVVDGQSAMIPVDIVVGT